jgi:hypothetical protein
VLRLDGEVSRETLDGLAALPEVDWVKVVDLG